MLTSFESSAKCVLLVLGQMAKQRKDKENTLSDIRTKRRVEYRETFGQDCDKVRVIVDDISRICLKMAYKVVSVCNEY